MNQKYAQIYRIQLHGIPLVYGYYVLYRIVLEKQHRQPSAITLLVPVTVFLVMFGVGATTDISKITLLHKIQACILVWFFLIYPAVT
jgi:hypothetical protein